MPFPATEFPHARLRRRAADALVERQRAAEDLADGVARIERGIGRLVDHLDAPQMVAAAVVQPRGETRPSKLTQPAAGGSSPVTTRARVDLPDPGLADDRDGVSARHVDRDVLQDRVAAIARRDIGDAEQRRRPFRRRPRPRASAPPRAIGIGRLRRSSICAVGASSTTVRDAGP